jgi:CubicO group peptidase (beta-lactamase class C family)
MMKFQISLVVVTIFSVVSSSRSSRAKEAYPFTYSLDQSIPCPTGCGQDYLWIHDNDESLNVNTSWVSEFLSQKIQELGSPSAGVVVNLRGKRVASIFVGNAKLNETSPPKTDSVFSIASITKTFATTTMFQLRDRGLLPMGLDTPVSMLLPEFSIRSPYPSKRPITLRSLAMQSAFSLPSSTFIVHTQQQQQQQQPASGLPREIPTYEPDPKNASETEKRVLSSVSNLTVLSSMYMSVHYSNLGLALLGRAIEKVTNTTWENYLQENILQPLGMKSSGNPGDYTEEIRSRVIDGVATPNATVPVHISESNSWGGACGKFFFFLISEQNYTHTHTHTQVRCIHLLMICQHGWIF